MSSLGFVFVLRSLYSFPLLCLPVVIYLLCLCIASLGCASLCSCADVFTLWSLCCALCNVLVLVFVLCICVVYLHFVVVLFPWVVPMRCCLCFIYVLCSLFVSLCFILGLFSVYCVFW